MNEGSARFARQIKKGVLEMLVLELLARRPGYGYELLMRLGKAPNGTLEVKEGTLYPILYRLEEEGLLVSGWQEGSGRSAPKKIYTVTPAGRSRLQEQKRIWKEFTGDVSYVGSGEEKEA